MKAALFLVALGLVVLSGTASAFSPNSEVSPGPQDYSPLKFEIQSQRLANGDIQFTVKILENIGSQSRFLGFPPAHYFTSLGTVKITTDQNGSIRSGEKQAIRPLSSELHEKAITCVFSVTTKELGNPDLAFSFDIPFDGKMPGYSGYYARLKKFMKP